MTTSTVVFLIVTIVFGITMFLAFVFVTIKYYKLKNEKFRISKINDDYHEQVMNLRSRLSNMDKKNRDTEIYFDEKIRKLNQKNAGLEKEIKIRG